MNNALIWGANGGIGLALTKQLAGAGWTVVAVARETEGLEQIASHVIEADVARPGEVEQAVLAAGYAVAQIDLWIYAAGDITSAKVDGMAPADWQRIIDANLTGAYLAAHFSQPLLTEDAHLFFLGAVSERMRLPGLSAYAAAKAGLEAFAEAYRKEARKQKVSVVRPGAVATPLWQKVPFSMPKDAMSPEKVAQRIMDAYAQGHRGVLDLT